MTASQKHWPALDGLRALAISVVLIEHCYQDQLWAKWLTPGYFGVRLFFVLSGFLITGILLKYRGGELPAQAPGKALLAFYVRRTLRIFPIYYLALFVMIAISPWINGLQGHHWWRLLYLTNFHMAVHNTGDVYYGHLWSLAVEEQFYLIWPFFILLVPRRFMLPLVIGIIFLGPLGRACALLLHGNDFWIRKPTWACFDSLGGGALLAIMRWRHAPYSPRRGIWLAGMLVCCAGILAALQLQHLTGGRSLAGAILLGVAETPIFMALIGWCASDHTNLWKKILCWQPLQHLGKISYGFYLYHAFLMPFVCLFFRFLHIDFRSGLGLHGYFLLVFLSTYVLSRLSWKWVEVPCNNLKRHFTYEPTNH